MRNARDKSPQTLFPRLGLGLGLRPEHYADVLEGRSSVSWFEVISENFMGDGGRPIRILEKVRQDRPVALHGVSLSVGSADPLNKQYLKRWRSLVERIEPAIVSDHLCWTGVDGENLHDLLPLPYTEETIDHVVEKVRQAQDFLKRRIALENVSSYIAFSHSEMTEWEFLSEIARRADCGILLDVNNIYVSAINHGFDALDYLHGMPAERIAQLHLAGHSTCATETGGTYLIDTHDQPVCDDVWTLYRKAVELFGPVSAMVEWDANIPEYSRLEREILKAGVIQEKTRWAPRDSSSEIRPLISV